VRWLPIGFVIAVLLFVGGTVYTTWRARQIDQAAYDISRNAAPSILHLTAARTEMRHLQTILTEAIAGQRPIDPALADMRHLRATIEHEVTANVVLPAFPGEPTLEAQLERDLSNTDDALSDVEAALGRGDRNGARQLVTNELTPRLEQLFVSMGDDIEFNARQAELLGSQIENLRQHTARTAFGLDALSAIATFVVAFGFARAQRRFTRLAAEHQRLTEERAGELEEFAGRVAHDILSPLATVALALPIVAREDLDTQKRADMRERGERSLTRVRRIVDGLLAFARAGARPVEGDVASVREVVDDLCGELSAAADEAHIDLNIDIRGAPRVATSPGVLTSVISNLAWNAIKYMGDSPVRTISIRAEGGAETVCLEVIDTGPGITPGSEERIFEPYVRDRHADVAGMGLGLATVKRTVTAHGGKVGVESRPGVGSRFWVDLPAAPARGAPLPRAHANRDNPPGDPPVL
jgi:signal transduction histidine kinase